MADEESNMALLEVGIISGYVPDRASLHSLLDPSSSKFIFFLLKIKLINTCNVIIKIINHRS